MLNKDGNSVLTKMLVSEKELNDNNFERLKKKH